MSYKAVLFDMDGVIVDSEPLHVASFQTTLARYGKDLTHDQYKQHFAGKTDEAGFQHYFDFIGETVNMPVIMDEKAKAYLALAADQLVPYPGVVAFIQSLAKQGIPLALVTGSLRAEANITLEAFGLTTLFAAVIAAEDITQSKPNPEGYLKAAEALGVEPADCVVIEDAPSGLRAAQAAGMRCAVITNTHTPQELSGATLTLSQLKPGCIDAL